MSTIEITARAADSQGNATTRKTTVTVTQPSVVSQLAGDPGRGRINFGWDVSASDAQFYEEIGLMRTVSYPSAYGIEGRNGNPARTPTVDRIFANARDRKFAQGAEGEDRIRDGMIVLISNSHQPDELDAEIDALQTYLERGLFPGNTAGAFCQGTLADYKRIKSQFNGIIWMTFANEPDASDKDYDTSAVARAKLCRLHRLWTAVLVKENLDHNVSIVTPTYIQGTFHANTTAYDAFMVGDQNTPGNWWSYHPAWAGTLTNWELRTVNGVKIRVPNRQDFYGPPAKGFKGPSPEGLMYPVRAIAFNTYCWHAMGGSYSIHNPGCEAEVGGNGNNGIYCDWKTVKLHSNVTVESGNNVYENHRLDAGLHSYDEDNHAGHIFYIRDALHGKDFPLVIGEFGYPVWETDSASDPKITMAMFKSHFDTMIEQRVAACLMWQQEDDVHARALRGETGPIPGSANAIGGRLVRPTYSGGQIGGPKGRIDTRDARGKSLAYIMDRPEVMPLR